MLNADGGRQNASSLRISYRGDLARQLGGETGRIDLLAVPNEEATDEVSRPPLPGNAKLLVHRVRARACSRCAVVRPDSAAPDTVMARRGVALGPDHRDARRGPLRPRRVDCAPGSSSGLSRIAPIRASETCSATIQPEFMAIGSARLRTPAVRRCRRHRRPYTRNARPSGGTRAGS